LSLEFDCGFYSSKDTVWIDNISLAKVGNDPNPTFAVNLAKTDGGSVTIILQNSLQYSDTVKVYAKPYTNYKWKSFLGIINDSIHNPSTIVIKNLISMWMPFCSGKKQIMNGTFFRSNLLSGLSLNPVELPLTLIADPISKRSHKCY